MDQPPQDQNSGAGNIDLGKIILPKKDTPSVDSAQRVDAGTLLNQEKSATLTPTPQPGATVSQPSPTPIIRESVAPLQTFQGDIASAVGDKGVSVVSIAAAEANRRGTQPVSQDAQLSDTPAPHTFRSIMFTILGLILIGGASGVLIYAIISNAPLPAQEAGSAPFIAIDGTGNIPVPADIQGKTLMQQLTSAKNSVSLSVGLVAQLYIEETATTSDKTATFMNAQRLLTLLAPDIPETLLRDISPVYLLGVHSSAVNQPFLILKVDSYELAYAGMLSWEKTMKQDLSPLFSYTPPPGIESQNKLLTSPVLIVPAASTTASSTSTTASSTIAATSSPQTPQVHVGFVDAIVENHDARVTQDQYGSVNFLWTFLDRQTLIITTNPLTLHEIIGRLRQAPLTSERTIQ